MDTPKLNSSSRTITGKQVKQLRRAGIVPGVVYGHDKNTQSIQFDALEFQKIYGQAGTSTLVDLVIDSGKPVKVLLHEPQIHPTRPLPVHADFYAVKMTEKLQTEIPLEFVGTAEAVEVMDGTLTIQLDAVSVECFPDKLVPHIEVDITSLKTFDDMIRVADIVAPDGMEILVEPEEVVATITPPRSEEELAELDEAPVGEDADAAAVSAVGDAEERGKTEEESEESAE